MSYLTNKVIWSLLNWHKQQASSLHRHRVLQREKLYFGTLHNIILVVVVLSCSCCCFVAAAVAVVILTCCSLCLAHCHGLRYRSIV